MVPGTGFGEGEAAPGTGLGVITSFAGLPGTGFGESGATSGTGFGDMDGGMLCASVADAGATELLSGKLEPGT